MEAKPRQRKREIDVTGLPEEAIRAVESVVSVLRGQPGTAGGPTHSSREEWAEAIQAWAENHPRIQKPADDSRESIYADRGE
jgi:hypothetical protein